MPAANFTRLVCPTTLPNVLVGAGQGGTFASVPSFAGNAALYARGGCKSPYWEMADLPPGPRLVFRISINSSLPLGGILTVTTCGQTSSNTAVYLGTGCPAGGFIFNCLIMNDDAAQCPSNPRASTLSRVATVRNYFVQVGSPVGHFPWSSGLQWTYSLPYLNASAATATYLAQNVTSFSME